jgi:signal transduction histidine kinase
LRRLPIRLKLAGTIALPLGALAGVTLIEVADAAQGVTQVRAQSDLARSVIGPAGVLITLQNERSWFAVALQGFEDAVVLPVEGYDETRSLTDEAIDAFRAELGEKDELVQDAFRPALDGLGALDEIRSDIDEITAGSPTVQQRVEFGFATFERYTRLADPFFDATTQIAEAVDDVELRWGASLADAAARQIEVISQIMSATIGNALLSEGGVDQPDEITELAFLQSALLHNATVMTTASGPYEDIAAETFPTDLTGELSAQVDQATTTGRVDLGILLDSVNVPADEGYYGYQTAVHGAINTRADDLNAAAEARRFRFGALAAGALALAVGLTWLVSRSITRPLQSLTRQATVLAHRRLPDAVSGILRTPVGDDITVPVLDPITVPTGDEVAEVAAALSSVQESATRLAVEQAVLRRNIADSFLHLGQRNQNLLRRQLDFITQLESQETDPNALAHLFQLDHLATRMRRNAENLLVLGGSDPPRSPTAPISVSDVVRAALGEIRDYHRVVPGGIEAATVVGSTAVDLAHLLAELIENALTHTPQRSPVEVTGHRQRHDGGYVLAVIDSGPGMTPAATAQANRRLAGTESYTVAPSKYLGHYVAATLAARHDIRLRLDPSPTGGITAVVELPPPVVTAPAAGHPGPVNTLEPVAE